MIAAHRCSGEFQPQLVKVRKKAGWYVMTFTVPGYKCNHCGEETISSDTASGIDKAMKYLEREWRNWIIPFSTTEMRF